MNPNTPPAAPGTSLRVAPAAPQDRRAIFDILVNSGTFGQSDAEVVDEMFEDSLSSNTEDGYRFLSCWEDGEEPSQMVGFACTGRESLTHDTWDLFWICVSSTARRKGVGQLLLAESQRLAAREHARLMVIYTSSTDRYAPARKLYESQGFVRAAVVPDYYADDDHLFIYRKRINV